MPDYRSTLERIERRVPMPEPAIERLLRRRERKLRAQRIATVVGALAIAVVGIGSALLALREGGAMEPAGGASSPPSPGGDGIAGFVLPTLAIWIGIAVVGLTAMTIARLRARPGASGAHERRTGASPGPGHGPATGTRAGTEEGGTTMDSKSRIETTGGVRLPDIRMDDGRVRRTNRWLTIAVIVLAAGLVALGTFVLIDRSGEEAAAPPSGTGATAIVPYTTSSVMEAQVTFDGTRCSYAGPTEVAAGTVGIFRYTTAAKSSGLTLASLEPSVTWEQVERSSRRDPPSAPPSWVTDAQYIVGSGTLRSWPLDEGLYAVTCATGNTSADRMFPAVMLRVIGG
ncbi:MAG TPA: hypothetical protein VF984_06300 [Actinomycetota bacterium]